MNTSQITMSVLAGTSSNIAESMVSYENDIALAVALEYTPAKPEFPMAKLGDLYEVPKTKQFKSGDMDNTGDSSFFNGKLDCPVGTHSEHSFTSDKDYFVMIKDGIKDHPSNGMGKFFKVNGKCSITCHNVILVQKEENAISHEYVYYYMSLNANSLRRKAISNMSVNPKAPRGKKIRYIESISLDDIMGFPIKLPPLSIQEEIVATLDRIHSTINFSDTINITDKAMDLVLANPDGSTLEPIMGTLHLIRKSVQMVADAKAQMVAIMKSVSGFDTKKLEEIATHERENGEGNAIIIKSGESAVVHFHKKYCRDDCLTIIPTTSECNIHYLYYYMKLNNHLTSTVGSIEWDDIKDILVPLPPIDFQRSVFTLMRALNDLSEMEVNKRPLFQSRPLLSN